MRPIIINFDGSLSHARYFSMFIEIQILNQVKNHIMCIIFWVYRNRKWGVYIECMLHDMMDRRRLCAHACMKVREFKIVEGLKAKYAKF